LVTAAATAASESDGHEVDMWRGEEAAARRTLSDPPMTPTLNRSLGSPPKMNAKATIIMTGISMFQISPALSR
jgi:hypothetical protein